MQPLLVDKLSKGSALQPIVMQAPPKARASARGTIHFSRPSSGVILIGASALAATAATYTQLVSFDVAGAIDQVDFTLSNLYAEQRILDESFAQLIGFSLEPDQPTDDDLIGHASYRFPKR